MKDTKQGRLRYRGRHDQERADIILPDETHLRLRSGDVIGLTGEQADWLMSQRPYMFWFTRTDSEPQLAVDATDVAHVANAPITP